MYWLFDELSVNWVGCTGCYSTFKEGLAVDYCSLLILSSISYAMF